LKEAEVRMKAKKPLVAVIYPASVPWVSECLRGIKAHADALGGWDLVTSPPSLRSAGEESIHLPALREWKGDGLITCLTTRAEERAIARLSVPVVNLSGWRRPGRGVPRVNADHRAIGRVAAEHLLALGLRRFAYYGIEGPWFSEEREKGFAERLAEVGLPCAVYRQRAGERDEGPWLSRYARLARWLSAQPRPLGLLAVHDYRARVVIELCARLGFAVPGDVAVLGVDDDQTACDYCVPPLSSVSRDPFACGVAAAKLLARLMKGERSPTRDTLVPPAGVVQRGSTDRFYDDDPIVGRVIAYATAHVGDAYTVAELARRIKVSRRLIELRFGARLGITPHDYLLRRRVDRAKALLLDTTTFRSLGEIAAQSGFGCLRAFRESFRAGTGLTPAQYRERHAAQSRSTVTV